MQEGALVVHGPQGRKYSSPSPSLYSISLYTERLPPRGEELPHWLPPPDYLWHQGCLLVIPGIGHEGATMA